MLSTISADENEYSNNSRPIYNAGYKVIQFAVLLLSKRGYRVPKGIYKYDISIYIWHLPLKRRFYR